MKQRITASALAISATALIGLAMHEGFSPVATRPVPNAGSGERRSRYTILRGMGESSRFSSMGLAPLR